MAFQFGPQILLMPVTGFAADHLNRHRLLLATQAAMRALALGLGLLTVTGMVQLWEVYVFALLHGCVAAFDAPARQTFITAWAKRISQIAVSLIQSCSIATLKKSVDADPQNVAV